MRCTPGLALLMRMCAPQSLSSSPAQRAQLALAAEDAGEASLSSVPWTYPSCQTDSKPPGCGLSIDDLESLEPAIASRLLGVGAASVHLSDAMQTARGRRWSHLVRAAVDSDDSRAVDTALLSFDEYFHEKRSGNAGAGASPPVRHLRLQPIWWSLLTWCTTLWVTCSPMPRWQPSPGSRFGASESVC